ncbi:PEP-CTERM sorting domain-containing protein [Ferribacterium limneticum]|uniref:PEP-CTERM sorting domain-containing protein n=1 Tax=Ferribacterium limneticum TaxID=76259 RepID=UPI001CFB302B|nr:PEP-CTERM sorting domain-containing protein [Ferribacterium limneticum]UCV19407.1 PEP-CTERM sorting domain-containing protein [Ferribacterium limneticum]
MNKFNLIAGLVLAISSAASHAAVIVDRADVPVSQTVIDFESEDGLNLLGGDTYNFAGGSITATDSYTVGQYIADLGENGLWGAGNHFVSFDTIGQMTMNISFAAPTKGVAFDYSIYEENADGSAMLTARYYDANDSLLKTAKFIFSPFGANSYDQFQSFGYVSDAANIARVSISGDGVVLDNLTFTAAVPEPESYAMLLAGLGLMGVVARRRSQRV